MTRGRIFGVVLAGGALAALLLGALAAGRQRLDKNPRGAATEEPAALAGGEGPGAFPPGPAAVWQGFLYGRVTTVAGAVYLGRLRFGGGEEAFWTDYFNGSKS